MKRYKIVNYSRFYAFLAVCALVVSGLMAWGVAALSARQTIPDTVQTYDEYIQHASYK